MNRMKIPIASRPRKLRSILGVGSGPEGRIEKLRVVVTELIRHERLEGSYRVLDESRGYAERLIQQACYFGPQHKETMETANFWLKEKDLIQKLFKVLVPRYERLRSSYTAQYILPVKYPEGHRKCVLELKGNPWPAVLQEDSDTSKWLTNVLIAAAKDSLGEKAVDGAVNLDDNIERQMSSRSKTYNSDETHDETSV